MRNLKFHIYCHLLKRGRKKTTSQILHANSLLSDYSLSLLVPRVDGAEDVLDLVDDLEVAVPAPLLGLGHPLHAGGGGGGGRRRQGGRENSAQQQGRGVPMFGQAGDDQPAEGPASPVTAGAAGARRGEARGNGKDPGGR